jgi:hypothetical protein
MTKVSPFNTLAKSIQTDIDLYYYIVFNDLKFQFLLLEKHCFSNNKDQ